MSTGDRPNVLLIISEDNGPHLGCYGDRFAKTPNLDRLASEGVRFANAFTTQAVCSPGRASILTGLYPHQCGQIGLATHKYALYDDFPNMHSLLKGAGYRTGLIGKLHINPESAFPFDMWWNERESISFAHRDVRKMAEMAEAFMAPSAEPFFLQISHPDAHLPFHRQQFGVPEEPVEGKDVEPLPFVGVDSPRIREQTADYYNCMSRLDTGIGLTLEALDRLGKVENTLVIYATDHGAQFSRGKTACYEGSLQEPLILRWPGRIQTGLVREEMVSHVDILPTVMEAVGVDCPPVAGASLLPLSEGQDISWREHLFAEWCSGGVLTYFPQRSVRDKRFKLIANLLQDRPSPSALGYAATDQRWEPGATEEEIKTATAQVQKAYETYLHPPPEELYDLEKDPWEFNNLADQPEYVEVQARLREALQAWQEETEDVLLNPAILEQLTREHDAIRDRYYGDNPWGRSRDYTWQYAEYLYQRKEK